MFHDERNLFFGRCRDGAVRIVKFVTPNGQAPHAMWKPKDGNMAPSEYPDPEGSFNSVDVLLDLRIPAERWASIIASVSAKGEESGRYYEALKWHNDK